MRRDREREKEEIEKIVAQQDLSRMSLDSLLSLDSGFRHKVDAFRFRQYFSFKTILLYLTSSILICWLILLSNDEILFNFSFILTPLLGLFFLCTFGFILVLGKSDYLVNKIFRSRVGAFYFGLCILLICKFTGFPNAWIALLALFSFWMMNLSLLESTSSGLSFIWQQYQDQRKISV
jgi:hypothetical protein